MSTDPRRPPITEPPDDDGLADNEEPLRDDGGFEDDVDYDPDIDDDEVDACLPGHLHKWVFTGTQYGGDDERYNGEGRCYCEHCGADGDG